MKRVLLSLVCVWASWNVITAHARGWRLDESRNEAPAAAATRASGTFDVKLTPLATEEAKEGASLGRMSIDKQFHGDLEGTSQGEMLTAGTPVKDSAGYVALERVSAKLQGRTGTFALQHSGLMNRGAPQLTITVVPDSGTGDLKGIAGTMMIRIHEGKHFYDFNYTINGK
jgi:hypothetical protein